MPAIDLLPSALTGLLLGAGCEHRPGVRPDIDVLVRPARERRVKQSRTARNGAEIDVIWDRRCPGWYHKKKAGRLAAARPFSCGIFLRQSITCLTAPRTRGADPRPNRRSSR